MKQLNILWTSGDPNTAHHMVFMYAMNAKLHCWWEDVRIIIWGASAQLTATDETIWDAIKTAQQCGVEISACISCANRFGVKDKLDSMDIEVIHWGERLTDIIKKGEAIITI